MSVKTPDKQAQRIYFAYDAAIEAEIARLSAVICSNAQLAATYDPRWLAIQLLEGDESLCARISRAPDAQPLLAALAVSRVRLQQCYGEDVDVVLVDRRYTFVHEIVQDAVVQTNRRRISKSDKLDRIVTHPIWGIPIFLALMWVVFKVTIDLSAPFLDWIELVMTGPVTNWVVALLSAVGLGGTWIESLAVDGVIAGVGGVLVFIPVMLALYLVLAMLEDCGYMARAAMVMDRLMRKVGLQGKSFLPMVVGFGCSVPAIYATRTLENRRDRILTGLLVPFMSCSARLPVYVLFAAIFFPQFASIAIFAMYLLGILIAIIVGLLLNHTLFKSPEQSHFIMELPPYRLPTARNVWRQMWERTSSFIHNAWTIILVVSIVLWFLLAIPAPGADSSFAAVPVEESVFGAAAGAIAPVFAPLGFGSWQASGSLLTGFVAKEVVIATMAQVYHVDAPAAAGGSGAHLPRRCCADCDQFCAGDPRHREVDSAGIRHQSLRRRGGSDAYCADECRADRLRGHQRRLRCAGRPGLHGLRAPLYTVHGGCGCGQARTGDKVDVGQRVGAACHRLAGGPACLPGRQISTGVNGLCYGRYWMLWRRPRRRSISTNSAAGSKWIAASWTA